MHGPGGNAAPNDVLADTQAQSPANEAPAARKHEKPAPDHAAEAPKEPKAGAQRKSTTGAAKPAPGAQRAEAAGARDAGGSAAAQRQLALEVTELKMSVENLERERDFYYSKLREVEVLCQNHEGEQVPFLQEVLDILYKTDDADEFIAPDEVDAVAVA